MRGEEERENDDTEVFVRLSEVYTVKREEENSSQQDGSGIRSQDNNSNTPFLMRKKESVKEEEEEWVIEKRMDFIKTTSLE